MKKYIERVRVLSFRGKVTEGGKLWLVGSFALMIAGVVSGSEAVMAISVIFIFVFPFLFAAAIKAPMIISCPQCKYEGPSGAGAKGSMAMELLLWCLFIVPGLIYSLWRLSTKGLRCPQCGWEYVIKKG